MGVTHWAPAAGDTNPNDTTGRKNAHLVHSLSRSGTPSIQMNINSVVDMYSFVSEFIFCNTLILYLITNITTTFTPV